MSMSDPIADMLTRIRNAQQARHKRVDIPGGNLKREVARVLLEQKFIRDVRTIEDDKQGVLRVYLKYTPEEMPVIQGIQRVSRPGRRTYTNSKSLPRVMGGLGVAIQRVQKALVDQLVERKTKFFFFPTGGKSGLYCGILDLIYEQLGI